MKEDYVSFEVAKLLKEKGFDESIETLIKNDGTIYYLDTNSVSKRQHITIKNSEINIYSEDVSCPTQQMAMKWLRETTNYELNVFCSEVDKNFKRGYSYDIFNVVDVEEKSHQEHGFNTYEEGVEAALEYTLKKLL